MERAPRMGIIGARRGRQGLGPFVARDLTLAGCEVVSYCTSSAATLGEAREQLASVSVEGVGFSSAEKMLTHGPSLDGVAILSPATCHGEHLSLALEQDLHVLCEKPLLKGSGGNGESSTASTIQRFHDQGLLLVENCQWPAAVTALAEQVESFRSAPEQSFAMGLAPEGQGLPLLQESLSHPISILQECLGPDLQISAPHWDWNHDQSAVSLTCQAHAHAQVISVRIELACTSARPRPAWLEFDGLRAHREVQPEDYSIRFRVEDQLISIPDPLTTHLSHFTGLLRATMGGCPVPDPSALIRRAAIFDALIHDASETKP